MGPQPFTVVFGQCEDGQALGHVFLQPLGQLWGGVVAGCHQVGQGDFGLGQVGGIPDRAQLGADPFADGGIRGVMNGVLGQVVRRIRKQSGELFSRRTAALPFRAAEDGPTRRTQTSVVVGNHALHSAHAARLQAFQVRRIRK